MVSASQPDPQELLPADCREDRAVVHRLSLYWLFAAGVLVGAGAALSVVGFLTGDFSLYWAFPVALAVAALGQTVVSWAERRRLAAPRPRD